MSAVQTDVIADIAAKAAKSRAGFKARVADPLDADAAIDTKSVDKLVADAIEAARTPKPKSPAKPFDPRANQECLDAIAKLFGVPSLIASEHLAGLTLVKGDLAKYDLPEDVKSLVIKGSDNEYIVTKGQVLAQNKVSVESAFEMALVAINDPDIMKHGVKLEGSLSERYMLQLAADRIGITITANRVEEKHIPAKRKAEFEKIKSDWDNLMAAKNGVAPAPKPADIPADVKASKPMAAPKAREEPFVGEERPKVAPGKSTHDFGPENSDMKTLVPKPLSTLEQFQTTSPDVAEAIKSARKIVDGTAKPRVHEYETGNNGAAPAETTVAKESTPSLQTANAANEAQFISPQQAKVAALWNRIYRDRLHQSNIESGLIKMEDDASPAADGANSTAGSQPVFVVKEAATPAPRPDKPHYQYVRVERPETAVLPPEANPIIPRLEDSTATPANPRAINGAKLDAIRADLKQNAADISAPLTLASFLDWERDAARARLNNKRPPDLTPK